MPVEPEYISISDAASGMGLARPTMYHYIKILGVQTYKFKLSREKFITVEDFQRIKEARQKPWLAGERSTAIEEDARVPLVDDAEFIRTVIRAPELVS
jgi:hypothetical protein